jgi:hypothetical protein
MKIDIEYVAGKGFLWILETDSGELVPGQSKDFKEIWESCRKLNRPKVTIDLLPMLP